MIILEENETANAGDEQFKIGIVCKNNLYSTQSPSTQEFTVTYRSNDVLSWRCGTGSNNTLWWDYTYKGLEPLLHNGDFYHLRSCYYIRSKARILINYS